MKQNQNVVCMGHTHATKTSLSDYKNSSHHNSRNLRSGGVHQYKSFMRSSLLYIPRED